MYGKKHMGFIVEKEKQNLLFKNCKCFFKVKRKNNATSLFFLEGLPLSTGYGPGFISVNLDNFF